MIAAEPAVSLFGDNIVAHPWRGDIGLAQRTVPKFREGVHRLLRSTLLRKAGQVATVALCSLGLARDKNCG